MDDFEYAVESQTLHAFLRQDQDHGATSSADRAGESAVAGTVGQSELERLMREMSDADLDALAEHLGVEETGKVGLMVPEGAEPLPKDSLSGDREKELESVGVKGTAEVVENPELELEKKMAEVEIGGKVETEPKSEEKGLGAGVVETLKRVEETVVGADEPATSGKEKLD
jgi:hypothetical protein